MAQFQPQGSCFHNPFTKDGTATSGRHCDFRLHLRLLPEASIAYVATKYDGIGDWWVKFRFFQLVISNVYNVCWWNCIFRYSHLILILSNKRAILKTFTDGVLSEILHPFAFLLGGTIHQLQFCPLGTNSDDPRPTSQPRTFGHHRPHLDPAGCRYGRPVNGVFFKFTSPMPKKTDMISLHDISYSVRAWAWRIRPLSWL